MKSKKKNTIRIILKTSTQAVLMALLVVVLAYGVYRGWQRRNRVDYLNSLDEVAVTVDGDDLTLQDLGFYVLYEEQKVEKEARIYNKNNTKDFWNIHTNGFFLQSLTKEAVMEMAIHDKIFYDAAVKEGVVITSDEKEYLENARTDFWSDLYDYQKEHIPGTYESVNRTIFMAARAEKYQRQLAKETGVTKASLNWDGSEYEKLKEKHKIKPSKVWKRVVIGDITLRHDLPNYINGLDPSGQ